MNGHGNEEIEILDKIIRRKFVFTDNPLNIVTMFPQHVA